MKKLSLLLISLLVVVLLGTGSLTAYTNSAYLDLSVTVFSTAILSVSNQGALSYNLGAAVTGKTNYYQSGFRGNFRNNGTVYEDYNVTATSTGMSLATGNLGAALGANEIRLVGVFAQWDSTIDETFFADGNDTLTSTERISTDVDFAVGGDSVDLKGYNVSPLTERNLRFAMEFGTPTTEGQVVDINIKVRVTETP